METLLRTLVHFLLFSTAFLFVGLDSGEGAESTKNLFLPVDTPDIPETIALDSTLIDKNVFIWKEASREKRMGNCRYLIVIRDGYWLREESEEASSGLCRCIDDAVSGMPTMNDDPIKIAVKGCLKPGL